MRDGAFFFLKGHLESNIEKFLVHCLEIEAKGNYVDLEMLIEELGIESPVEQMFYISWHFFSNPSIELIPQFRIGKYKVDFLINPISWFVNSPIQYSMSELKKIDSFIPKRVVEIDGHDFHEKTKSQAQYDKTRERDITSKGFIIYRFTGSEVFNKAQKCVSEMWAQSNSDLTRAIKRFQYHKGSFNGMD